MHGDIHQPDRTVLGNGLRIVSEQVPFLYSTTVGAIVECGSRDDPPGSEGCAHLLEHLFARRAADILRLVDDLGGVFEAATERESTVYYLRVEPEAAHEALCFLKRLLFDERHFGNDEFEREKQVVASEIAMYEADAGTSCLELSMEELWGRCVLSRPIRGTASTIGALRLTDVQEYLTRHYTADRVIVSIVAAGGAASELHEAACRLFDAVPSVESEDFGYAPPLRLLQTGYRHRQSVEPRPAIFFNLATDGLSRSHPDRVCLFGLSGLLGEGLSSRILRRLRLDEGLVYDVGTSYQLFRDVGILSISGVAGTESIGQVLDGIELEIARAMVEAMEPHEVARVRRQLRKNLLFNLEDPELRMLRLLKLEMWFRRTFHVDEEIAMIDEITATRTQELAASLFVRGSRLITVGPAIGRPDSSLANMCGAAPAHG